MSVVIDKEWFINRLAELRNQRGISARDMSLSLGQSAGYINNIENGVNLPSMTTFFYICEFLEITPETFFDLNNKNPGKLGKLTGIAKALSDGQLDLLIAMATEMER